MFSAEHKSRYVNYLTIGEAMDNSELLAVLKRLLDDAIYTCQHENPSDDLKGYLQGLKGTLREAIKKALSNKKGD